jgi:hypothetical protein
MKPKIIKSNWRVEVEPSLRFSRQFYVNNGYTDEQIDIEFQRECDKLAIQIQRHVDNWGGVRVMRDIKEVCPYCGYNWEKEPGCCDEAIKEYDKERKELLKKTFLNDV